MAALQSCTIGYPRIGAQREMKTALERYWKGQSTLQELLGVTQEVQAQAWQEQQQAGISLIAADGTLYDQVLDTIFMLGIIPQRFKGLSGHELYFAMARGVEGAPALDMSKFFDTNYHNLVPELEDGWQPKPDFSHVLDKVTRCQQVVGRERAVPAIIGPLTFACLARHTGGGAAASSQQVVQALLPAYQQLLAQLKELQVPEVQLHEPYLTTSQGAGLQQEAQAAYAQLAGVGLPINLTTYYDDLGAAYPWVVQLPVAAITMDFLGVPGAAVANQSLQLVRAHGFPADKTLCAGVVDGRSVWADTGVAAAVVGELLSLGLRVRVTSSAPLQHLPLDVQLETKLPADLKAKLGFARQKLAEIVRTAQSAKPGGQFEAAQFLPKELPVEVAAAKFSRPLPYAQRRSQQIQMPAVPTTTIGSFPQTPEVRRLRLQFKQGRISQAAYEEGIAAQIGLAIGVQEALDLDVLVHGEAERTDMVEYFGQNLDGMAFTEHGWVQSYGSRYVRPPLVVGDIRFTKPMTVKEFQLAQSLTRRPVKGMLTGPVTILNWSFPRRDITRKAQALQLALALREEVASLEAGGCRVIQVDEPALREGLPLKAERWPAYLTWAVDAFRLCTAVAAPATQVVTHLCYSDFEDIMGAIHDMDADVLTIENSRSGDEMIRALAASQYGRDLGPGVYDVHSPVVPSVDFMKDKIKSFLATGILGGASGADRLWVNPDCGLKTRTWEQTIPALRNMVQAAKEVRAELEQQGHKFGPTHQATASSHAAAGAGGAACCGCR